MNITSFPFTRKFQPRGCNAKGKHIQRHKFHGVLDEGPAKIHVLEKVTHTCHHQTLMEHLQCVKCCAYCCQVDKARVVKAWTQTGGERWDARSLGEGVVLNGMRREYGEMGSLTLFPTTLSPSLTPLWAYWPWSSQVCSWNICCSLCLECLSSIYLHGSLSHPVGQFKCHVVQKNFADYLL